MYLISLFYIHQFSLLLLICYENKTSIFIFQITFKRKIDRSSQIIPLFFQKKYKDLKSF